MTYDPDFAAAQAVPKAAGPGAYGGIFARWIAWLIDSGP